MQSAIDESILLENRIVVQSTRSLKPGINVQVNDENT